MTRSTLFLVAALTVVALGGCVVPEVVETGATDPGALFPTLAAGAISVSGLDPLVWEGSRLTGERFASGPGETTYAPCSPSSCERFPFRVDVPAGYWESNPGFVEVSIEWEHQEDDYRSVTTDTIPMGHYLGMPNLFMHLRVFDSAGKLVADGVDAFHFASIALIRNLPAGDYEAEVEAYWGTGSYVGVVQIEPATVPDPGDQLPDLIVMPPSELTLEHPIGREAPDPLTPFGRKGCDPDEAFEFGAVRCLRFATGFGNHGPGRLEMRLSAEEAQAATVSEGQWVQSIFHADGTVRSEPASPAQYHKVHGHYHILGLDVSTVYEYDFDTATRGKALGEGRKTGFCPVDSALIFPTGLGTTYPTAYGGCCYMWGFCQLDYTSEGEYHIGLTAGWYDVYPWWRADQYVDIAGVPDGVYELETCANPEGYMAEVRMDNNCGSAVFRLTGDEVEILDSWSEGLRDAPRA